MVKNIQQCWEPFFLSWWREKVRGAISKLSFFLCMAGVAGLYDYGPSGCAMEANMINIWKSHFVLEEQMLEIRASLLTPHSVLKWVNCWRQLTKSEMSWGFSICITIFSSVSYRFLEVVTLEKFIMNLYFTYTTSLFILHLNTNMHNLHTALFLFPKVLTRRICLTIKSFFSWWSFPLFWWL